MVHGPDLEPTVRGTIRSVDGTDESRGDFVFQHPLDEPVPHMTGACTGTSIEGAENASLLRVWRDGSRVRVEELDGLPNVIVGDHATWTFDRTHDQPLESSRTSTQYGFRGT